MSKVPVLDVKTILVTGSSGNLGSKLCNALKAEGYEIVGVDLEANSNSEITNFYKGDVGDSSFLSEIATDEVFSRLSGIVNCFFYPEFKHERNPIPEISREQRLALEFKQYPASYFSQELAGNVSALHNVLANFLPIHQLDKEFSVVNVGSILGIQQPNPKHLEFDHKFIYKPPGYSVSKSAVIAYTEYCANLFAGSNFRFNTVVPGFIDAGQDEAFISRFNERLSIKRFAQYEEIVNPILFLLSRHSNYMTGATLTIDGGYSIS